MRYRQLRTLLAAIGACVFVLSTCPSTSLASDDYFGTGDGIPDVVEEDGFVLQGGRGVGCHVGVTRQGQPAGVLLLLLGLFLGIRRYRRT